MKHWFHNLGGAFGNSVKSGLEYVRTGVRVFCVGSAPFLELKNTKM